MALVRIPKALDRLMDLQDKCIDAEWIADKISAHISATKRL
jgi:hypothetical protein